MDSRTEDKCEHVWIHMPDRDWMHGHNGRIVDLAFYCEKCLKIEVRTLERGS